MLRYRCKVCKTEDRRDFGENHLRCIKCLKKDKSRRQMELYRKSPEIRRKANIIAKRYRERNKEKYKLLYRARDLRRRIKLRELGYISGKTVRKIFEDNVREYGILTCIYCLIPLNGENAQIEHKIPISRGGTNEESNLGVSCVKCNKEKYTKTESEYRRVLDERDNRFHSYEINLVSVS